MGSMKPVNVRNVLLMSPQIQDSLINAIYGDSY